MERLKQLILAYLPLSADAILLLLGLLCLMQMTCQFRGAACEILAAVGLGFFNYFCNKQIALSRVLVLVGHLRFLHGLFVTIFPDRQRQSDAVFHYK